MKNGWMRALAWERTQCEVIEPYTEPCTVESTGQGNLCIKESDAGKGSAVVRTRVGESLLLGVGALGDIGDGQSPSVRDEAVREWAPRIVGVR